MDIFTHIFKMVTPIVSLVPHLLQTYVYNLFQYTTKLAPHVPQNVHFEI